MLSPDRRARDGGAHLVEHGPDAHGLPRRDRARGPRGLRRSGSGGRRDRHRPGLPPLDPAAGRRPRSAHRDPLGRARLRGPLRPAPDRDVAARDRGRPRHARGARRGRDRGDDPRAVAGGGRADRRAATLPRGRRRRAPRRRRVLRRRPVRGGLVRACRDRGRRPVRPGAHPAADGPRRVGRGAADTGHRERRRAVRAPPVVPRPVPRAPRGARGGDAGPGLRHRPPGGGGPRTRGHPASLGPDPRPHVVELPPRRPALVGRVPRRPRRPLEGAPARGAGPARRQHRRRDGVARARAAAGGRRVGGARRVRRRDRRRGGRRGVRGGAAAARGDRRGPAAAHRPARGAALAARDVRLGRLVLGRPVASGDAPGPAVGGAGGPDRGRPRRAVARVTPGRRPRGPPIADARHRRQRHLRHRAERDRTAAAGRRACEDQRRPWSTSRPASAAPDRPQLPSSASGHELDIERGSDVPISTQIYWQLAYQIESGRLQPGTRLPPVRELGAALRVNPNTVRAVYRRLADAGYVVGRHGAGTRVVDRPPVRRGSDALAGIVAETLRRAAQLGFTPDEVAQATFTAATEHKRPGPLVRVLFAECTSADATFDAERIIEAFPDRIEAMGVLLEELPERLERYHYDLVATTTFHADEAQAYVGGLVPVVAMLVGPGYMSLVHEVAGLPPGSKVGLVCGSQRGVENIAEVLQLAGATGVEIVSAVAHTEAELERRGPRGRHRPAVARGDGARASTPGSSGRSGSGNGATSSTRPGSSSSGGRSSASTPPARPSRPEASPSRRRWRGRAEMRHSSDASAAHLANGAPALRARCRRGAGPHRRRPDPWSRRRHRRRAAGRRRRQRGAARGRAQRPGGRARRLRAAPRDLPPAGREGRRAGAAGGHGRLDRRRRGGRRRAGPGGHPRCGRRRVPRRRRPPGAGPPRGAAAGPAWPTRTRRLARCATSSTTRRSRPSHGR